MDPDVLRRFGANPTAPRRAHVDGWRLAFTPHANMVPDAEGRVEGVLYELTQTELDRLYGPDGYVTTYEPVEVVAHADAARQAGTFVERAPEQPPEAAYVDSLLAIMRRAGLPSEYIENVRR